MTPQIDPERILRYIETVTLLMDGGEELADATEREKFITHLYTVAHLGTAHKCQHPEWSQEFYQAEATLIEKKHLSPWRDYLEKKDEDEIYPKGISGPMDR